MARSDEPESNQLGRADRGSGDSHAGGQRPVDPGLDAVLRAFRVEPDALLGRGGEACVYALDGSRVLRVPHVGAGRADVQRTGALVRSLAGHAAPFAVPEVLDIGEVEGRWYTVERRLAGRAVFETLDELSRPDRAALIEAYLDALAHIGDLPVPDGAWWGEVSGRDPVRADAWPDFLRHRAGRSLAAAGSVRVAGSEGEPADVPVDAPADVPALAAALADTLVDAMGAPDGRCLVHLDAFPGNVLAAGTRITAVIDFGPTTLAGDRRLDPLSGAVYLTPAITPTADERDRDVARSWLRSAGLAAAFEPAERWLAAFWSFATEDHDLHAWCRSVLGPAW